MQVKGPQEGICLVCFLDIAVTMNSVWYENLRWSEIHDQTRGKLWPIVLIDLILGDLLQSLFSVVSAPDNIVQSKLVSLTKMAGF